MPEHGPGGSSHLAQSPSSTGPRCSERSSPSPKLTYGSRSRHRAATRRAPERGRVRAVPLVGHDVARGQRAVGAVRVDLREGSYADPIRVAQGQAEALVKLVGFYSGRPSWRQLNGYVHIIDDVLRGQSSFAPPIFPETGVDRTTTHSRNYVRSSRTTCQSMPPGYSSCSRTPPSSSPTTRTPTRPPSGTTSASWNSSPAGAPISGRSTSRKVSPPDGRGPCVMHENYRSVQAAVDDPQLRGSGFPPPN